jgi:hypothetical protein
MILDIIETPNRFTMEKAMCVSTSTVALTGRDFRDISRSQINGKAGACPKHELPLPIERLYRHLKKSVWRHFDRREKS